ncbi:hypothetical protein FOA52_015374 [Chlamydomonas sp. UWO 241]|nr:hypothetical protein FOA52_015374 [Chlamydomonas sp. UWO 241]
MTIEVFEVMKKDPIPLLIAQAILSNVGGCTTMIGDSSVIIIGNQLRHSIGFIDYLMAMAPGVALVIPFALTTLVLLHRADLAGHVENFEEVISIVDNQMRKLALRPSPPRAMGTRSKTLKDLNNLNLMALGAGMAAIAADAAAAAGGAGAGEESMEGVMVVAGTPSPRACLLTPGRGTRGATNAEVPSSAMSSPVRAPADHDEMHMGIPPPDPSAAMHRGMRELLREEFAEQRDLIREEFSRGMAALAARVTVTEARVAGVIAAVATLDARITSKLAQADVAFGPLLRLVPELSVAKDGVADLDERMGRMEKHEVLALAQFHVDQGKSREMAAKVAALTEQVQALEAAARGGEAAGRQVPVAARAPVTVAQPVPAAQQQLPGPPQPPGPPPLPAAVSGGGLTFAVVVRERVSDARHALARGTERALTTLLGPHNVTVVQARVMFANDHKSKVVFTVANEGHAAFIRARMLLPRCTANMRRPGCAIFPHLPYAEHQSQRRMAMRGGKRGRRGVHRNRAFRYTITEWALFYKCIYVTGAVIIGFLLQPIHGLAPAWIAVIGATVLIVATEPKDVHAVLHAVEWDMLLFFAAMFILIEAAAELGLIRRIVQFLQLVIDTAPPGSEQIAAIEAILWFSAIFSALLDNVPYVITMLPVIEQLAALRPELDLRIMAWSLAFGACLGGNATMIGASANIVTVGLAAERGYPITFGYWLKTGVPTTIMAVAAANIYLIARYGFA